METATTVETPKTETTPATTPVKETPTTEQPEESTLLGKEKTGDVKTTAPEKYEVKLEGFEIDSVLLEGLTPVLKKHGVTNEALQELAAVYAPHVQKMVQDQQTQAANSYKEQVESWKAETNKMLGVNAKEDIAAASRFIDRLSESKEDADALRELFDSTGLGNHPLINKIFIRGGKIISEDAFVEPSQTNTPSQNKMLETMYPKMAGKK